MTVATRKAVEQYIDSLHATLFLRHDVRDEASRPGAIDKLEALVDGVLEILQKEQS
jgi:hypothetical protein